MMPGPTQFIECPGCRTIVLGETLGSGNTYGAKIWSDGFMIAPMLPDYPDATKCRRCAAIFWLADGHLVKEDFICRHEYERQLESGELAYAKHLTIPDLKRFLHQRSHSLDQETELRMRLWWGMNHRKRNKPSHNSAAENLKSFEANLYILLHLLHGREEGGLRLRCEALRELRRFDDVMRLATEEMSSFDAGLLQILEKCRERESHVFAFTDEDIDCLAEVHVAGIGHYDFQETSLQSTLKITTRLLLCREPANKYDSNAIEVYTDDGKKIGYIPKDTNMNIARVMDEGVPVSAAILHIDPAVSDWFRIKIAVFRSFAPPTNIRRKENN